MAVSLAELVALVAERPAPQAMATKVVAIDGAGGAGKTTLSRLLATGLGGVPIVATDDFASWDTPVDWWPRLLSQVLEPLGRNQPARYRRYDWDARRLAEWHRVPVGGTVLLEGVSASRAAFGPYLALAIWVDTPRAVRLRRGLARDGEQAVDLWHGWMSAEDDYIARERPDLRADVVVPGTVELA